MRNRLGSHIFFSVVSLHLDHVTIKLGLRRRTIEVIVTVTLRLRDRLVLQLLIVTSLHSSDVPTDLDLRRRIIEGLVTVTRIFFRVVFFGLSLSGVCIPHRSYSRRYYKRSGRMLVKDTKFLQYLNTSKSICFIAGVRVTRKWVGQ